MVYSLSKFKYFQVMWYIICQNTRIKTKITFCYIPHFSLIFCIVLIAYNVHNIMPCRGEMQYPAYTTSKQILLFGYAYQYNFVAHFQGEGWFCWAASLWYYKADASQVQPVSKRARVNWGGEAEDGQVSRRLTKKVHALPYLHNTINYG